MNTTGRRVGRGRPVATTPLEIERAAFELFTRHGFAATTMDDIARAVGVGRRTLFRYFDSKNDIPWGQFDRTLDDFRQLLAAMPHDLPLHEALARGIVEFNEFPADAQPSHRTRMRLILTTPELQSHSVIRYADWRRVIAEFVADRTGQPASALLPQVAGHVCLALAISAYEAWLEHEDASISDLLAEALEALRQLLDARPPAADRRASPPTGAG